MRSGDRRSCQYLLNLFRLSHRVAVAAIVDRRQNGCFSIRQCAEHIPLKYTSVSVRYSHKFVLVSLFRVGRQPGNAKKADPPKLTNAECRRFLAPIGYIPARTKQTFGETIARSSRKRETFGMPSTAPAEKSSSSSTPISARGRSSCAKQLPTLPRKTWPSYRRPSSSGAARSRRGSSAERV